MTREEQIKEAARQRANQYDHPSKWSDTYYGFIDGAKWADKHPQWIPVDKELPPHRNKSEHKFENDFSENCFVSDGEFIDVGYYDYRLRKWNCEFLTNVICWYIPQPPRKEE